ncbi:transcription elongation factor Elf1 [Paenibacillus forsythiae]|uniref:Transcription elongation factor Elf1 n=1 Tax=Paenibacillus forsythiae TaxID=365616 RepID=A0ABU3H0Z9_9BACL|nr:hypothetical protein [Paenibacillus forsythiae]MDT3424498.1 transcription elongation factor Elf1 [Paenibacillus forsythiae]
MKQQPYDIHVKFVCQHCGQEIGVVFNTEPVTIINCGSCHQTFTVMRPAIAEEILLDWENEALFQKIRADKSQSSNASLMMLIINVIELLTWRDKGDGQVEAIKAMRRWLIENEGTPVLAELMQSSDNLRLHKRNL